MTVSTQSGVEWRFRVVDALDHPHGGRVLRLRLEEGSPPPLKALRAARLAAVSPEGAERRLRGRGFALFGGRPSDERLARTGRIDLVVRDEDGETSPPVGRRWVVGSAPERPSAAAVGRAAPE